MTRKRMEHADEEFLDSSLAFMEKAVKADKPFFIWHNTTRMHVWTRLQEKYQGISGVSIYADGELNAVRWQDWKLNFAVMEGNISNAIRLEPNWPQIIHLRADPFEKAPHESGMYMRWMADNMWLFVPMQDVLGEFFSTLPDYPMQVGQLMNPASISSESLQLKAKMQQLDKLQQQMNNLNVKLFIL